MARTGNVIVYELRSGVVASQRGTRKGFEAVVTREYGWEFEPWDEDLPELDEEEQPWYTPAGGLPATAQDATPGAVEPGPSEEETP